jgi:hypothetical protein
MNNMSNAAAAVPPEAVAWCGNFAGFALVLAQAFLILALIVALVETAISLWAKLQAARKAPVVADTAATEELPGDAVKVLEALKAVLEALKGLPAWIAIFLAGLALLWMAGQKPELCASSGSPNAGTTTNRTISNGQNPARPRAEASNVQAPAATNAAQ